MRTILTALMLLCLYHFHLNSFRGSNYEDKLRDLRTVKQEKKSIRRSDDTPGFRLTIPA